MIPFMDRVSVRPLLMTTKPSIASAEAFDDYFSQVPIEDADAAESLENYYLFDGERPAEPSTAAPLGCLNILSMTFEVLRETSAILEKSVRGVPLLELLVRYFEYLKARYSRSREEATVALRRARQQLTRLLQEFVDVGAPVPPNQLLEKKELLPLLRRIRSLEAQLAVPESPNREVTREDVFDFLAEKYKKPRELLTVNEQENLLHLEEHLNAKIVGQQEAVAAVAEAVRLSKAGLKAPNKPIGTFLFPGPTGVGKTALVYRLCAELGLDPDKEKGDVIQLNMSEFTKKGSAARLIGAAPGYVGFEDKDNLLTTRIIRKPRSLVVFDEIDKLFDESMDPEEQGKVLDILLQILEDGRLTDSHDQLADFSQSIVVLTSNGGMNYYFDKNSDGSWVLKPGDDIYREIDQAVLKKDAQALDRLNARIKERCETYHRRTLRPEFLNRLDGVITFHLLPREELEKIGSIMLADTFAALSERMTLKFRRHS